MAGTRSDRGRGAEPPWPRGHGERFLSGNDYATTSRTLVGPVGRKVPSQIATRSHVALLASTDPKRPSGVLFGKLQIHQTPWNSMSLAPCGHKVFHTRFPRCFRRRASPPESRGAASSRRRALSHALPTPATHAIRTNGRRRQFGERERERERKRDARVAPRLLPVQRCIEMIPSRYNRDILCNGVAKWPHHGKL